MIYIQLQLNYRSIDACYCFSKLCICSVNSQNKIKTGAPTAETSQFHCSSCSISTKSIEAMDILSWFLAIILVLLVFLFFHFRRFRGCLEETGFPMVKPFLCFGSAPRLFLLTIKYYLCKLCHITVLQCKNMTSYSACHI